MNIFRRDKDSGGSRRNGGRGSRRSSPPHEPEVIEMTEVSTWGNPPGGALNAPLPQAPPPAVAPAPPAVPAPPVAAN